MLLSIFVTSQQLTKSQLQSTFSTPICNHIHFYNLLTKPASLFTLTHIFATPLLHTLRFYINAILHSFLLHTTQSFTFTNTYISFTSTFNQSIKRTSYQLKSLHISFKIACIKSHATHPSSNQPPPIAIIIKHQCHRCQYHRIQQS